MSLFDDHIAVGNAGLMDQLGEARAYWPGGASGSAVTISIALNKRIKREDEGDRDDDMVREAEAMVLVSDVAAPVPLSDIIVDGSEHWRVMEISETVGGMHRLGLELMERSVRGRGRGRRG